MLKYPCLVLDHDDTVVRSEETINYPFFCRILDEFRPGVHITLAEYTDGCYRLGFNNMCRQWFQFSEQELADEFLGWKHYIMEHAPKPFAGIDRIIHRQKSNGGMLCVVSHSSRDNILRDYRLHFSAIPDAIYGWDLPEEHRKPNVWPLEEIMHTFHLTPTQLLVVDDMKPGWSMAHSAGVPIAFAEWGRGGYPQITQEMTRLCDYSFASPGDLEKFLFEDSRT